MFQLTDAAPSCDTVCSVVVGSSMSFLYFDRSIPSSFTVRSENDRDEEERNEDDESDVSSRATNQSSSDAGEASLTDHEVITGFPPGYLHSIYRESHHNQDDGSFGGTILSSAPSDDGLVSTGCFRSSLGRRRCLAKYVIAASTFEHNKCLIHFYNRV